MMLLPATIAPAAPLPIAVDELLAVPGDVVVTLATPAGPVATPADLPAEMQPLLARFAVAEATWLPNTATYRLRATVAANPGAMAAAFAAAPGVVAAEPNWLVRLAQTGPNDPLYQGGNQWHLRLIDAAGAWAITTGDPSVLVAIVDSGLDPTHPDLAGKVIGGYDFIAETFTLTDPVGHGTAGASCSTANTDDGRGLAGLAPGVRLAAFRALGTQGGASFDVARGIIAAADAGARVINCSLGSSAPARSIQDALAYADRKGAVVVVAAGNGGTARLSFPAAERGVIAVGATNWRDEVAAFSQRGPHVAVSAPGAGVLGARAGAEQAVVNGTSFAAPIVSGVVALMLSVAPSLTPADVRRILEGTADDIGPAGFDPAAGWGRVNAARAVAAARAGDTLPNRRAQIAGRVTGADPAQVVIEVEPFGEVVQPAADGRYEIISRGRTTYTLRATARDRGAYRGPISITTTGQLGERHTVDIDFDG
ncbi:MAG: S8 family serine peptidase [Chloroflexi bacterium]|nr:S8 family serine peptidase [Chloroflexota bacterium]